MTAESRISIHQFDLDSGNLALDFANTLDDRNSPHPAEHLPDYLALLDFIQASGLIDEATCDRLAVEAAARRHEAIATHASALALREAIFEIAAALVAGKQPGRFQLEVVKRAVVGAVVAGEYVYDGEGFRWSWESAEPTLERPIWHIGDAAVRLFSHSDLSRLRICAASDCDWVFLDETRNRSRKWCDMNTCGNRAKVARYRSRRD